MAMWWVVNTSRGQQQVYAPTSQDAVKIVLQQTGETVAPPSGPGFPAQVAGVPVIAAGSGGSFADQWSGSGLASDQTQPSSGYLGDQVGPFPLTIGGSSDTPIDRNAFESEFRGALNKANLGGGGNP